MAGVRFVIEELGTRHAASADSSWQLSAVDCRIRSGRHVPEQRPLTVVTAREREMSIDCLNVMTFAIPDTLVECLERVDCPAFRIGNAIALRGIIR